MQLKSEIRIVGWDDCSFCREKDEQVRLVGAITRGGGRLDGLLSTHIHVDGEDATAQIGLKIENSPHADQLSAIMLDGITFGGLNVVNMDKLHRRTQLPVVAVTTKAVDFPAFKKALTNVPNPDRRWQAVKKAGELVAIEKGTSKIYFQHIGIDRNSARRLIEQTATQALVPEPLRLAHLIASGLSN